MRPKRDRARAAQSPDDPKLGSFGAAVWRMGVGAKPIPPWVCAVRPRAEIGFVRSKSRDSRRLVISKLSKSVGKRDLSASYDQRRRAPNFMILEITARNFGFFDQEDWDGSYAVGGLECGLRPVSGDFTMNR